MREELELMSDEEALKYAIRCPECGSLLITAEGMARAVYDQNDNGEMELMESETPDDYYCRSCGHDWKAGDE